MNLDKARKLQNLMPYKTIFFDSIYNCYRLFRSDFLYEYQDENGTCHKRQNPETLIPSS